MPTILLTGATGLIGRELTRNLLARGHTVIATSRSGAALAALADENRRQPGTLVPMEVDLMSSDMRALAAELHRRGLRAAHLVNNARDLANLRADANASQRAQWVAEYTLGVVVPVELSHALAEAPDSALASVINISSIYGMVATNPALYEKLADRPPMQYGVTKAALLHLTKELAVRLAPKVRVNAITYGGIEGRADDDFKHRYGSLSPLKRMMRPDEMFGPLEFLISDAAASVTGHNLVADGGWTLW